MLREEIRRMDRKGPLYRPCNQYRRLGGKKASQEFGIKQSMPFLKYLISVKINDPLAYSFALCESMPSSKPLRLDEDLHAVMEAKDEMQSWTFHPALLVYSTIVPDVCEKYCPDTWFRG